MTSILANRNTRPTVLAARIVGIAASTLFFGQNGTLSLISIPILLMAPVPVAARQFEKLWVLGHTTGPALAVITTLANAYVAYHLYPKSLAFKLSLAASSLAPIIYSFTWAFMQDIDQKLFAKAKILGSSSPVDKGLDAGLPKSETTHGLIQMWGNRHLVRSSLATVSSILAIWAALVAR